MIIYSDLERGEYILTFVQYFLLFLNLLNDAFSSPEAIGLRMQG